MRNCKLFLVITAVVVQTTTVAAQMATGISWQSDLDAARAVAQKEQKLLLIHFYSDTCGPCQMLEARVFNQPTVAGEVHSHYIPVKLNTDEFPRTAERFGITRIPTDVVITPQGQVLQRFTSPGTPMDYIRKVSSISTEHESQLARNFPTSPTDNGTTQSLNSPYSGLSVAGDNNSYTTSTPTGLTNNPYAQPTATPSVAPQTTAATPVQPAPTATVATQQPAANPVSMNNPYANPTTPVQTTPTDRYAAAPTTPATSTPPMAAAPAMGSQVATAQPAPSVEPQLPPNSPPLGFFGYCTVSMKQDEAWKKGDARWGCYHRGRTYLFASAEKRDAFLADPDGYAPALSGIDPVLAIDTKQAVEGKQQFGIEYDGKFYLFSSEDNLRKFFNQPQHYADGVRQAMLPTAGGRMLK